MRFLLIILLLCAGVAFGDGLPVVDGKIVDDHTMIDLTDSQAEEIAVLNTLTLTSDQWRKLSKIGPACPKRFYTLLPIDHNDCTCGYSDFAIIVSAKKAAILHSFIRKDALNELSILFTMSNSILRSGSRWEQYFGHPTLTVQVDRMGRFYLSGTEIPFDQLRDLLSKPQRPPFGEDQTRPVKNERRIVFQLPPGVHAGDALKKQARELKETAIATGWSVGFDPVARWEFEGEEEEQ